MVGVVIACPKGASTSSPRCFWVAPSHSPSSSLLLCRIKFCVMKIVNTIDDKFTPLQNASVSRNEEDFRKNDKKKSFCSQTCTLHSELRFQYKSKIAEFSPGTLSLPLQGSFASYFGMIITSWVYPYSEWRNGAVLNAQLNPQNWAVEFHLIPFNT